MNCMNCGNAAGHEKTCPHCGCDLSVQRKAFKISEMYYNEGLEKAQIRDLSGAVDLLKRSLRYNKRNITARNLLGLVYFEVGEIVSALSEWVISKNIMPDDNIASEYIDRVQSNPEKMEVIHKSIKRYNIALQACREGNNDIGVLLLKKALGSNPQLIKAYHLLSLIYIQEGTYEKARKILKRAAHIDRTNATTLRFLKEIDEQTGIVTNLEDGRGSRFRKKEGSGRKGLFGFLPSGKKEETPKDVVTRWEEEPAEENEAGFQNTSYRDRSPVLNIIYLVAGIIIGALVIWFLAIPVIKQQANRDANDTIVRYSAEMSEQGSRISELEKTVATLETALVQANASAAKSSEQAEQLNQKLSAYEKLLEAYEYYGSGYPEQSAESLSEVDTSQLSGAAQYLYNVIKKGTGKTTDQVQRQAEQTRQ